MLHPRCCTRRRYTQLFATLESQSTTQDDVRRELVDATRRATVLEVQEILARRKAEYLQESESVIRREYNLLHDEHVDMEKELREKIATTEQNWHDVEAQMLELQTQLKGAVPREDVDTMQADYGALLRRHQELVVTHSNAATQVTEVKALRTDVLTYDAKVNTLNSSLTLAELRAKKAEEIIAKIDSGLMERSDPVALERRCAALEIQMKTQEHRAINAEKRASALKAADDAATERVASLEAETKATTAQLHKEMDEADKLRRLMETALPQSKARKLEERLAQLEGEVMRAKAERDKYKSMAAIASKQASTIQGYAKMDAQVGSSLRRAIVDLQAEGEEKNIIATLHQKLIGAKLSDVQKVEKIEEQKQQGMNDRAKVLELEEETNGLRVKLLRAHAEGTLRERNLERRLQKARDALAGCVKMEQQEKAMAWAQRLQASNANLEKALTQLQENNLDLESQVKKYEMAKETEEQLAEYEVCRVFRQAMPCPPPPSLPARTCSSVRPKSGARKGEC